MFRRAQDRIRTYYYKTKDELVKSPDLSSLKVNGLLKQLQDMLKAVCYFGCYFDRRCGGPKIGDGLLKSLCDEKGNFECQGRWDKDKCLYNVGHEINPYKSKEDRIVFQTWNLDHSIERSRAVIPAIKKALREEDVKNGKNNLELDIKSIFSDLFTLNNLKFVHIVCHDKGAHFSKEAGPYLM